MPKPIASIEEFYAHALAIEHEAAERYREFERYYHDRGELLLASLCANLARAEAAHFDVLLETSRELRLPSLAPGAHRWLESGSPEAPARELFYRVAQPRQLLEIALAAELAAQAYFERAGAAESPSEVRLAALEMAEEERRHVGWVREALAHLAATPIDWARISARLATPGAVVGAEEAPPAPRRGRPKR
jgi:rubrerythrin